MNVQIRKQKMAAMPCISGHPLMRFGTTLSIMASFLGPCWRYKVLISTAFVSLRSLVL
jgi:hypothetical protein